MKTSALGLGIAASVVVLAAAGGLTLMAGQQSGAQHRAAIELVRELQQRSAGWSVEVARVRSDPLADFDALATFIPRMARLKERLADTARHTPDLPDRLAGDVRMYLSALDAQEERIERFKTGYAVVRNSVRYLPLAAAGVAREARATNDAALAARIATLLQDLNLYLASPAGAAAERVGAEVEALRTASVGYAPALANALANLLAHAEVLLARSAPTGALFEAATANETADIAERLADSLAFELDRRRDTATLYERGVLALIALLALFWVGLALHQRVRPVEPTIGDRRAPLVAAAAAPIDAGATPAPASPAPMSAEAAMRYRYHCERVGESIAAATKRLAARADALHHGQQSLQRTLDGLEFLPELPDSGDLDEQVEANAAVAALMRREVNAIADLARRLAAFAQLPNGVGAGRDMVDVNACVEEVVAASGANDAAEVSLRLGALPELFASRTEVRLLLAQVLDNSVHAVGALSERRGTIKRSTPPRATTPFRCASSTTATASSPTAASASSPRSTPRARARWGSASRSRATSSGATRAPSRSTRSRARAPSPSSPCPPAPPPVRDGCRARWRDPEGVAHRRSAQGPGPVRAPRGACPNTRRARPCGPPGAVCAQRPAVVAEHGRRSFHDRSSGSAPEGGTSR